MGHASMTQRVCKIATCNLNQWAMDFTNNLRNIEASIEQAKASGCSYRLGPELEVPGYGCEDHFLEADTVNHSWEVLVSLVQSGHTDDIVVDLGMPVLHRGVRYNCRVILLNRKVLHIRPKLHLADDGNYREGRYFSSWKRGCVMEQFRLPEVVAEACEQQDCPIGHAVLQFKDAVVAAETCEELFTPMAPNSQLALSGVDIIFNGSGSHHQLRKLETRIDLMRSATAKAGGVYVYSNQRGGDGGRLYYDGCACIFSNGGMVAQGAQFGLKDVEVVHAVVDLSEVESYRGSVASLQEQAASIELPHHIDIDFKLCISASAQIHSQVSLPLQPHRYSPMEEIAYGPAAWLWDYLRRSGASGFLLPLSGGADSSSTAAIVGCMCQTVFTEIQEGNVQVLSDTLRFGSLLLFSVFNASRVLFCGCKPGTDHGAAIALSMQQSGACRITHFESKDDIPTPQAIANKIFVTIYMGTKNSSQETERRAKTLASEVGSYHISMHIDSVVEALVLLFQRVTGMTPKFKVNGGSTSENLALQNIQARLRMVVAFLFAQLLPWVRGMSGFLLVLGSANVDELLRGYLTKYDCSSADINPIGGVSKADLRAFLQWGAVQLGYTSLKEVEAAPPTAELEPIVAGKKPQNDEDDMGISYEHLGVFGRLRKINRLGPVSMFFAFWRQFKEKYTVQQVAEKVKFFFRYYAINRHKATTITPAYHAESYSPDDNRFDHRQFLYNSNWPWQFSVIDSAVEQIHGSSATVDNS